LAFSPKVEKNKKSPDKVDSFLNSISIAPIALKNYVIFTLLQKPYTACFSAFGAIKTYIIFYFRKKLVGHTDLVIKILAKCHIKIIRRRTLVR